MCTKTAKVPNMYLIYFSLDRCEYEYEYDKVPKAANNRHPERQDISVTGIL